MIILTFRGLISLVGTRNTSVMVTNVGFLYLGINKLYYMKHCLKRVMDKACKLQESACKGFPSVHVLNTYLDLWIK